MSTHNDFGNIGDLYGSMLNGVKKKLQTESCGYEKKQKPGQIGEAPLLDEGGPTEKGGFKKAMIDKKTLKKGKKKTENAYNIDKLSQDQEVDKESRKIAKESINNFMRKKSHFDRLFENVMNGGAPQQGGFGGGSPMGDGAPSGDMGGDEDGDLDALGIEGEGDELDEGGDDVTFTLDRTTAQTLIDVLQSALGDGVEDELGDDEFGDDEAPEGDLNDDDMGEEDEEGFWDEDEEDLGTPVSGAKEVNYGKNNKVGNLKVQSGGASSAYTSKQGPDGDHGHAISSGKQPNMGKNNKVGSLKPGKSMFEQ